MSFRVLKYFYFHFNFSYLAYYTFFYYYLMLTLDLLQSNKKYYFFQFSDYARTLEYLNSIYSYFAFHIIVVVYFKFSPLLLLFCIVNLHSYLSPYLPLSATLYFFLNFMFLLRIVFFLPEEFPLLIVLGNSTGDEFFSFCLSKTSQFYLHFWRKFSWTI